VIETKLREGPSDSKRVRVMSVGTARAASARVIADGFGLHPEDAIARIYRAPSVLVDNVNTEVADQLVGLLSDIGLEVVAEPSSDPPPPPSRLYDVSVYVRDERRVNEIAQTVAEFVGSKAEEALDLLRHPTGVVVGAVSEASVQSLISRLDDGADVTWSRPEDATFSVLVSPEQEIIRRRVIDDLAHAGIDLLSESGLVARGLSYRAARELWQRHGGSQAVHVVNEAFLRFDVVLDETARADAAIGETLQRLAGIPEDLADDVVAAAPITLNVAVRSADLADLLQQYYEAGLVVHASMVTFQRVHLEIQSCPDLRTVDWLFDEIGLPRRSGNSVALPLVVPLAFGDLDARLWKCALRDAGVVVDFVESDQ
jgi:hypothetical protein